MNLRAYRDHKRHAKLRGIEFLLSYREWLCIWEQSGHLSERGRGRGKYVMARYGDVGPYSKDNVRIVTNAANVREAMLGNKGWLGPRHSEATKLKMSQAGRNRPPRVGWKHSEATKQKISLALRNRSAQYEP